MHLTWLTVKKPNKKLFDYFIAIFYMFFVLLVLKLAKNSKHCFVLDYQSFFTLYSIIILLSTNFISVKAIQAIFQVSDVFEVRIKK